MRRRAGPGRGLPFPSPQTHARDEQEDTDKRPQALHLVVDGVYRRSDAGPFFVKLPASTDDELQTVLHAEVFSSISRSRSSSATASTDDDRRYRVRVGPAILRHNPANCRSLCGGATSPPSSLC